MLSLGVLSHLLGEEGMNTYRNMRGEPGQFVRGAPVFYVRRNYEPLTSVEARAHICDMHAKVV